MSAATSAEVAALGAGQFTVPSAGTARQTAAVRAPSVSELLAALEADRATGSARGATTSTPPFAAPASALATTSSTWLLAAHSASGATCVASALSGLVAVKRCASWPMARQQRAVLVCRSSYRGLSAAQQLAREFRDGKCPPGTQLVGVVISAAAPGRIPAPLRRIERLLPGAVPILGRVPWMPQWRLGPPIPEASASWAADLATAIAASGNDR